MQSFEIKKFVLKLIMAIDEQLRKLSNAFSIIE